MQLLKGGDITVNIGSDISMGSSCMLKYILEIPSKLTHIFLLCQIYVTFLFIKRYLYSSSLTFHYPVLEEGNLSFVLILKKTKTTFESNR